jgi:protease-4
LASEDPRVAGILLTLRQFKAGSATALSLRNLLLEARRRGKRTAVYLPEGAGTVDCYIAASAERLLVGPRTQVAPLGFALQAPYLKKTFGKLGVQPEVFAAGEYKAAGESFVRESMSPAQREQVEAYLNLAFEELVAALATGRGVSAERAKQWIDHGLWSAEEAVTAGLCDALSYPDELQNQLAPERDRQAPLLNALRYAARRRRFMWRPFLASSRIAVIDVSGPIVSKAPGGIPVAAEADVSAALERVLRVRRYKAAVVYINSRGGSAVASDRILRHLKRLNEKKPTVACFGDTAASGGYMIGVGARAIVAQPTTITGSIGVVTARFGFGDLLDKLGVSVDGVKRGARADMFSSARSLHEEERSLLKHQVDAAYEWFVHVVAEGRSRSTDEIEPLARGRIYSGRQARDNGLVDRLGGLDTALALAGELCGRPDLAPELIMGRRRSGFIGSFMRDRLGEGLGEAGGMSQAALLNILQPKEWIWAFYPHGNPGQG